MLGKEEPDYKGLIQEMEVALEDEANAHSSDEEERSKKKKKETQ